MPKRRDAGRNCDVVAVACLKKDMVREINQTFKVFQENTGKFSLSRPMPNFGPPMPWHRLASACNRPWTHDIPPLLSGLLAHSSHVTGDLTSTHAAVSRQGHVCTLQRTGNLVLIYPFNLWPLLLTYIYSHIIL